MGYCRTPNPNDPMRVCDQPAFHTGQHQDAYGTKWTILSEQPDRAAQVEEIQTLNALDSQLSTAGFSREELTAAAARQQRISPTKAEILAAIDSAQFVTASDPTPGEHEAVYLATEGVKAARAAVEKLYADRGL